MLKIKESYATLPAQDIKRARKFYEEKLGLTPAEESPDGGASYKTGNTGFGVFPSSGKSSGDHTQIGLEIEDVRAAVSELKGRGVKFEDYDFPGLKTEGGIVATEVMTGAWFKDTEGNLLGLIQTRTAVKPAAGGRETTTNGR
jgi:catechol 2,3-dioxygenase-like lactoylglutathione lyase family enzyme